MGVFYGTIMVYKNFNRNSLTISAPFTAPQINFCEGNGTPLPFAHISGASGYILFTEAEIPTLVDAARCQAGVSVQVLNDRLLLDYFSGLNDQDGVPYGLLGTIPPRSESYYENLGALQLRKEKGLLWLPTSIYQPNQRKRVWILYRIQERESEVRISLAGGAVFADESIQQWIQ